MKLITNLIKYENDLIDVIKLFFPVFDEVEDEIEEQKILHECCVFESNIVNKVIIENKVYERKDSVSADNNEKFIKRYSKLSIYEALSKHFKKDLPWGALTGVRPTKIAYELLEQGTPKYILRETLMKQFYLSYDKANLLNNVIKNQNCIIKNDKLIDIYINIPICPSRCEYCSFISSEYDSIKKTIPIYLETLKKEIEEVKKIIYQNSFIVRSIYIGGGTPSVLTDEELEFLLSSLSYPVTEFTVEAGRPETITREKLEVLKKHNVTRICINPQSFVEKTLKRIGRKHTVKDILSAYKLALEFDFNINMDIIAGLPEEKFHNFKKSLNYVLEMAPTNITVHTLAVKRGAKIADNIEDLSNDSDVIKMLEFANLRLTEEGYSPYYIYRQKNMLMGLENVGYTKPNGVCIFNVDSMEETCSVIACGANAISKRIFGVENRIERCANVKFIHEYIERIDEMIERKKKLFN